MAFLLYTIHVLVSFFLILVVLLQQGKGADLSVFGGGATMTAFGARGAASLLHKLTVAGFVIFILTTLTIGVYQTRSTDSVLGGLDEAAAATATDDEGTADDEAEGDEGVTGVLPEAEEDALKAPEGGAEDAATSSDAPFEAPPTDGTN